MTTKRTTLTATLIPAVLWMAGLAIGQEITIVFPPEYEDVESPVVDTRQSVTWPNGARIQWAIPGNAFASLPETHRWLTELRQRPDSGTTSPRSFTADISFKISTTSQDPEGLNLLFADNVGDDETLVIDGPITLSTENTGPRPGPRAFDVVMKFEKPFYYDPNQGNLLIDWTFPMSTTWTIFSDGTNVPPGGAVYNTNASSPLATDRAYGSLVWQAVFVPEPSTAVLYLIGLLGLMRLRRHA